MTAAAAVLARGSQSVGVTMGDDRRRRLVASIDADSMRQLDALAAARYGGNRSRAIDDAVKLAAAVLTRPYAFGLDPLDALAAYCKRRKGEAMQADADRRYMVRAPLNPADRDDVSRATAFDHGEPFASEAEVKAYFTRDNLVAMFGPEDAADTDQSTLDAMAAAVLANRWHCAF